MFYECSWGEREERVHDSSPLVYLVSSFHNLVYGALLQLLDLPRNSCLYRLKRVVLSSSKMKILFCSHLVILLFPCFLLSTMILGGFFCFSFFFFHLACLCSALLFLFALYKRVIGSIWTWNIRHFCRVSYMVLIRTCL